MSAGRPPYRRLVSLAVGAVLLLSVTVAPALANGFMYLERKVIGPDTAGGHYFGNAVALSDDRAVVGAPYVWPSGAAYVFRRTGDVWAHEATLLPSDAPIQANFGTSVALNGDTIVVGASGAEGYTGAAYVFTRSGTSWAQQAKLIDPAGASNEYFGGSVALDDDTVLVGAPGDSGRRGSAVVFVRAGSAWTVQQRLAEPSGSPDDAFGYSVALVGDRALVGAYGDDVASSTDRGSVFVFTRSGSSWSLSQTMAPPTSASDQRFGYAVAVSGGTALVGTQVSKAQVYVDSGGTFTHQQTLTASDGPGGFYGWSVGLAGDTAIVGSPFHNHAGVTSGSAYVYTRSSGVWTQQVELLASDRAEGDRFSLSVACTQMRSLVGASWADAAGVQSGAAYIYGAENVAPVAVNDSYVAAKDKLLLVAAPGLLANDLDANGDRLSVVGVSPAPAHGTLYFDSDGSFEYRPNAGFVGTDTFKYQVSDGALNSGMATVSITVAPGAVTRIAGADRYLTAVEASKKGFPSGAETVVIATGENWPDALGGSALAGAVDGPLLLTRKDSVPAAVLAEIDRLGATKAYVLGSTSAVSNGVKATLEAALGAGNVKRLGGVNRYATGKLIADEAIAVLGSRYTGDALIATGLNFPDATAAAPLAAALGRPVLLADPVAETVYVPSATKRVVILGGTTAVPSSIENALKAKLGVGNVVRKGGSDRFETAAMVAAAGVAAGMQWNGVGLATGLNFPDALAGGAMLGERASVLLLTRPEVLSPAAQAALHDNRDVIGSMFVFGQSNAVSPAVEAAAKAAAGL